MTSFAADNTGLPSLTARLKTHVAGDEALAEQVELVHEPEQHVLLVGVVAPHVVDELLLEHAGGLEPRPQVPVRAPLQHRREASSTSWRVRSHPPQKTT